MKKLLIITAAVILIGIACIYVFIPSTLTINAVRIMPAPLNAVYRCVNNETNWPAWLNMPENSFHKKYRFGGSFINAIDISINKERKSIKTTLHLLSINKDSTMLQWKAIMASGKSPVSRIRIYNEASAIKRSMDEALQHINVFTAKNENIYGVPIYESSIQDTLLITTKTNLEHNPSTRDIYALVDALKAYAEKSNAQITGYPMYNVTTETKGTKRLMVAIPVNRELKQHGSIASTRMVPGKFLITEVKGGEATVQKALGQLKNYIADYSRTSMAIPFAYLVTDRRGQPDTSQWVTKIYAPVY